MVFKTFVTPQGTTERELTAQEIDNLKDIDDDCRREHYKKLMLSATTSTDKINLIIEFLRLK